MAKTIEQIQAAIDAQNLDARQLINLIVDYLQANPPGGGGAIPTLAQVLEAGNSAGGLNIDMELGTITDSAGPLKFGANIDLQGSILADVGGVTMSGTLNMGNNDITNVNEINGEPYPPA